MTVTLRGGGGGGGGYLISIAYCLFFHYYYFRKVSLMEDSDQNIHLKNLSVHQAGNEEDALNLLFLGDTNRMIAEVGKILKYCDLVTFESGREKICFLHT